MMKIGLVSAILPDLSFEELFDYSAGVGFEGIEVCCWPVGKAERRYAGVTHIDLDGLNNEKQTHYLKYAEKLGMSISSLGYYPNALSADEEEAKVSVNHIKRLINASADMSINMITTFIGRDQSKTVEENLVMYEKVWSPIVKLAEEKKVKIAIENCPMFFTKDESPGGKNLAAAPYLWREIFERIPSDNLGLNYDPSHLYLTGVDHVWPIYEFKDKIFHVHFKDIRIDQEKVNEYGRFAYPVLWHSPKIPGLGEIDFSSLISALNDVQFNGYACIEIEDKTFEGSENDVKVAIGQSFRYLKQFLP